MTIIDEIYAIVEEFGFYDYGPLIGILGDILSMICISLAFTMPVMVAYSIIIWVTRWIRSYDD